MSYRDLGVIDSHVHFPVENTMAPPADKRPPPHPLLQAYARERGERTAKEWNTEPAEPPARTEAEATLERWVAEVERHGLRRMVFVSANTNDRLNAIVRRRPDRFLGRGRGGAS